MHKIHHLISSFFNQTSAFIPHISTSSLILICHLLFSPPHTLVEVFMSLFHIFIYHCRPKRLNVFHWQIHRLLRWKCATKYSLYVTREVFLNLIIHLTCDVLWTADDSKSIFLHIFYKQEGDRRCQEQQRSLNVLFKVNATSFSSKENVSHGETKAERTKVRGQIGINQLQIKKREL